MRLNDTLIRNAKPTSKPQKLADGDGLYLFLQPNGARWWRMKYYFRGKEKMISLGVYPDVSLKLARQRRQEVREHVAAGIDPSAKRKAEKQADTMTFESVAREWCTKRKALWSEAYADGVLARFEQDIFPLIGKHPIRSLDAADFLDCLNKMVERGVLETAHKMKAKCSEVMRYAVATRRAPRDPIPDLRGALMPVRRKHHPTIIYPSDVGVLLRNIDGYRGKSRVVRCALRLLPLVFVRSSELRYATWEEIDLANGQWKIPASRMKMKNPHIVPLSRQAMAVLSELHPFTGPKGLVFPSVRTYAKPISENTVNAALRLMGYAKDEMTGHGFRSMASTLLNEQGWPPDAIERQLAHIEQNDVRAAYNYAEYLPQRREMMQAWADYLDSLRSQEAAPDLERSRSPASRLPSQ